MLSSDNYDTSLVTRQQLALKVALIALMMTIMIIIIMTM